LCFLAAAVVWVSDDGHALCMQKAAGREHAGNQQRITS
jgi:hypothetical protein